MVPYAREKLVFENGLRTILDRRSSAQSVAITCLVRAGSQLDFPDKDGLAHVVEHFLFRTKASQKEQSLLKAIEDTGGGFQAFTGLDRSVFSVYAHKDDAKQALQLISKIICDLPADEKSFELEKAVVAEELAARGEDSSLAFQRNKYELLGGDESLKHSVGGTREKVKGVGLEDVQEFYGKYYVAKNMVLSIVGDFDREEIISQISLLFGSIPSGSVEIEPHSLDNIGPKLKTAGSSVNLVAVFFRCPSFRAKELAAVELIGNILSGGSHSLLFQRLREQEGLVYWVNGSLDLCADFGSLDITTSTSRGKVKRVLAAIVDEVSKLRSRLVSEDDLAVAKNRLMKCQILNLEDVRAAAQWYAERESLSSRENADDFRQWVADIERVSANELKETARRLFLPANCFVYTLGHLWPWQRWSVLEHIRSMEGTCA